MSDLTFDSSTSQASRIGLAEEHEVHGWCQALGVTEAELRVAVAAVGDDADEVRGHLGRGG
ncbi:DUF3606 domain-containing protein [Roseateles sp. DC23W]|uniref:DUF3606 domain-containing protein n=1 Tax=Pelomonas dachongensis TaxID=3299029 RepID=A0ABW7EPK0_9BURK